MCLGMVELNQQRKIVQWTFALDLMVQNDPVGIYFRMKNWKRNWLVSEIKE